MNKTTTFWFGLLGAILFIIPSVLGGFQFEDYNHIHQFISESYASGTPYGIYLRFFGFIPSGIFITLFAFSAWKFLPKTGLTKIGLFGFGVFYGIGTIIVGLFPCDIGCNREFINPSLSQIIHNFSGGLTYLFVPICFILIGVSSKSWNNGKSISNISIICGAVAFMFSMLLANATNGDYIGLFQRIIESFILFWLINFALYIKNNSHA